MLESSFRWWDINFLKFILYLHCPYDNTLHKMTGNKHLLNRCIFPNWNYREVTGKTFLNSSCVCALLLIIIQIFTEGLRGTVHSLLTVFPNTSIYRLESQVFKLIVYHREVKYSFQLKWFFFEGEVSASCFYQ